MPYTLPPRRRRSKSADESFARLPDLLIVDGGKGQLGVAVEVLQAVRPVRPGAGRRPGQAARRAIPARPAAPVLLPRRSQALYLVQRVRDEAHRFALTRHRHTARQDRPGLPARRHPRHRPGPPQGPAQRFGSLDGIREASVDELAGVRGHDPRRRRSCQSPSIIRAGSNLTCLPGSERPPARSGAAHAATAATCRRSPRSPRPAPPPRWSSRIKKGSAVRTLLHYSMLAVIARLCASACTSSTLAACPPAPSRPTFSAPAATPHATARGNSQSCCRPYSSPALNASPAPVASTTGTRRRSHPELLAIRCQHVHRLAAIGGDHHAARHLLQRARVRHWVAPREFLPNIRGRVRGNVSERQHRVVGPHHIAHHVQRAGRSCLLGRGQPLRPPV